MKTYVYKIDPNQFKVAKTPEAQEDFWVQGHPLFVIPDFEEGREDIWIALSEYIAKQTGGEVDDNGGGIESYEIIDEATGLTRCKYVGYDISVDDEEPEDVEVEIEGYVVEGGEEQEYVDGYNPELPSFVATKVVIKDFSKK